MAQHTVNRACTFICGVLVILFVAACGSSPSTSAPTGDQGNVTITKVVLQRDNGNGEAGDVVDKFHETDRSQFFDAETSSMLGPGSKVHWIFTAVDTTAGKDIKVVETDVNVLVGNHLTAHVSLPNNWPTGTYRADIYINGNLVKSYSYTIDAAS